MSTVTVMVKLGNLSVEQKIQLLRRQLGRDCLERSYEIDALIALFITGQHGLLLGPPGTGKTMLLELICKALIGANYFSLLVGADSKPDDFFGPVSIKALKEKEIYRRNTKNRLPTAHVAYLDEIFKTATSILNLLLKLINERVYYNPDPEKVTLRTLIGSSNEVPNDSAALALMDRFTWKCWIGYLKQEKNIIDLWTRSIDGYQSQMTIKLTLADYDEAKALSSQVKIKHLLGVLMIIKSKLENAGYIISDRKWLSTHKFLQAIAWIKGEASVTLDILHEYLPDCIWVNPDDRLAIARIISEEIARLMKELVDIKQAVENARDRFDSPRFDGTDITELGINTIAELEKQNNKLSKIKSGYFSSQEIAEIEFTIMGIIDRITNEIKDGQVDRASQHAQKVIDDVAAKQEQIMKSPNHEKWIEEANDLLLLYKDLFENIKEFKGEQEPFKLLDKTIWLAALEQIKSNVEALRVEIEKQLVRL